MVWPDRRDATAVVESRKEAAKGRPDVAREAVATMDCAHAWPALYLDFPSHCCYPRPTSTVAFGCPALGAGSVS